MVAVSVDTNEESARLAEGLGLEFPIMSDVQEEAIRTWGLVHENGKPGGGAISAPRSSWSNPTEPFPGAGSPTTTA